MNNNTDKIYNKYKDLDFEDAKSVDKIPALAKLQAETNGKTRITIRIDNEVLSSFKAKAEERNGNYQTLINDALKQFLQGETLAEVVKKTIKQELAR
ncbi:MAG: Unknown protein [uncultured Thiotrichaceae bacterium]|uniref:CopG family transcriptional regulator n=1 Tax=uncultured Thiotrichaceae bacterium TaxID=298394 RepID=A0A6S6TXL5_9GAMM|nr:MAG: Unknown protein [uncultured Thiotrichaceae bacterium]